MIQQGNTKLGKKIWTWSIPAIEACPGRSKVCEDICYACTQFFTTSSVKDRLSRNFELSKSSYFVGWMKGEIFTRKINLMRLHVAGDVYSKEYALKLLEIARGCPSTNFYLYTRSWRVDDIRPILEAIAALDNVQLWYSWDRETGFPANKPDNIRTAYLMTTKTDVPSQKTDLVFRDAKVRRYFPIQKTVNGNLVCPVENGVTKTTCSKCGICWDPKYTHKSSSTTTTIRKPLTLVT